MARIPLGDWKPKTQDELDQETGFENEALQNEVERDTAQWVQSFAENQGYEVEGKPFEVEPKVLDGLMNAEVEE